MHAPLVITLAYFFSFAVYGVLVPFLPIILHEQGLSDSQVTLALTANGLAAILSPLLVSHFADRIFSVRHLLATLWFITALISPCWLLSTTLSSGFIVSLLYYSLVIPALVMLDAFTVQYTRTHPIDRNSKKQEFQMFRIWGSIGFMLPGVLLLPLSYFYQIQTSLFIVLGTILAAFAAGCSLLLPHNQPIKTASSIPSKEALLVASHPPLRGIFIATCIAGLALSIFYIAFPRFLQELGSSPAIIGLVINFGVICEILLMPFTAQLIGKIGARNLVLIALASIPLRLFIITLWPSIEIIVATQILHAPLVIGLFICIPIYLGEIAGDSYRFSLQSLNTTLVLGLSRMIGPCLGALTLAYFNGSAVIGLRASLVLSGILGAIAFITLLFSASEKHSS